MDIGGDEHLESVVGSTEKVGGPPSHDVKKKKLIHNKNLTKTLLKKEKRSHMARLPPY
jgi:hypothetical protein